MSLFIVQGFSHISTNVTGRRKIVLSDSLLKVDEDSVFVKSYPGRLKMIIVERLSVKCRGFLLTEQYKTISNNLDFYKRYPFIISF